MKPNTQITIGLRNVGDSSDPGQTFNGTLRECLAWQIQKLGETTMATRIITIIARNETECLRGLGLAVGARSKSRVAGEMLDTLLLGLGEDSDDESTHTSSGEAAPTGSAQQILDDYQD